MKKLVVVINGKGGVGKDTLCDFVKKLYRVKNVSAITPIKKIASENGWNGEKDARSRKFLADLKKLFVEYNDLPLQYLVSQYNEFLKSKEEILFIHIREGEEIDKFRKEIKNACITLLIKREIQDEIVWGNSSDDNVEQYHYDYQYNNEGNLKEAEKSFCEYMKQIFEKESFEINHVSKILNNTRKFFNIKFETVGWRNKSRV